MSEIHPLSARLREKSGVVTSDQLRDEAADALDALTQERDALAAKLDALRLTHHAYRVEMEREVAALTARVEQAERERDEAQKLSDDNCDEAVAWKGRADIAALNLQSVTKFTDELKSQIATLHASLGEAEVAADEAGFVEGAYLADVIRTLAAARDEALRRLKERLTDCPYWGTER